MANLQKHIHKLKKHKYKSGNETYFCTLDCNYKVTPALALGKKSICWRCGDAFDMSEYSIRLVKPHCDKCHKSKGQQKETSHKSIILFSRTDLTALEDGLEIDPTFGDKAIIDYANKSDESISLTERLHKATQIEEDEEEL